MAMILLDKILVVLTMGHRIKSFQCLNSGFCPVIALWKVRTSGSILEVIILCNFLNSTQTYVIIMCIEEHCQLLTTLAFHI